jgi:hypothetical protein
MRSLRITIGLATAACLLAVYATPSFAAKEKVFFGHFTASIFGQEISPTHPAIAKGKGEASTLRIGPLQCAEEDASGNPIPAPVLNAKATVEAERSSNFTAIVKINGCKAILNFGKGGVQENVKVSFGKGLKMEFHANGSAALGNPAGEVKILETVAVPIKVPGHKCKLFIPAQTVPVQDEKKPETEFEAATYGTESEAVEPKLIKKYPSGFKERLEIEWELKKVVSYVPIEPGRCEYKKGTEGKFEPEGGGLPNRVEFNNGLFSGELEETEIKGGELGFDPTPSET